MRAHDAGQEYHRDRASGQYMHFATALVARRRAEGMRNLGAVVADFCHKNLGVSHGREMECKRCLDEIVAQHLYAQAFFCRGRIEERAAPLSVCRTGLNCAALALDLETPVADGLA